MEQQGRDRRTRRARRNARPVGRQRLIALLSVVGLFVIAGGAFALIAPGRPANKAAATSPWRAIVTTQTPEEPVPTPAFASIRGATLHLPVPAAAVTIFAFHQSAYRDTVPMTPMIALGSPARAKAAAVAARATIAAGGEATIAATPEDGAEDGEGVWTGSALQLWRSTSGGKQDSAVDCGARYGTPVLSPVDGVVMQIRPYKLYGKYDDFEIHIKPDAWSDLDVIVLHVTDPLLVPGTRVVGGVTQIARVRRLSKLISGLQLRTYTLDGGNHTHVQVNRIPKPNETWRLGQDPPGFVRHN
jgi:hypothetical protein